MTRGDIIFIAEGSVRYHRCRAEHFAFRNRWLSILSAFLGTGVVAATIAQYPLAALISGVIIALANTYRLVAKPDQIGRDHERWCREWGSLLGEVQGTSEPNGKTLSKWISRVSDLNSQCFEDMKAAKNHCYNEAMTALGRSGTPYVLTKFQKWSKNLLPHTHSFDQQNLLP